MYFRSNHNFRKCLLICESLHSDSFHALLTTRNICHLRRLVLLISSSALALLVQTLMLDIILTLSLILILHKLLSTQWPLGSINTLLPRTIQFPPHQPPDLLPSLQQMGTNLLPTDSVKLIHTIGIPKLRRKISLKHLTSACLTRISHDSTHPVNQNPNPPISPHEITVTSFAGQNRGPNSKGPTAKSDAYTYIRERTTHTRPQQNHSPSSRYQPEEPQAHA